MNYSKLFNEVEEKEILKIIKNIDAKMESIKKNRTITINNNFNKIGIIINGTANLEMYDYNGNRIILEKLDKNSIFSNIFFNYKNEIIFNSLSNCEILFFKYDLFSNKIKNNIITFNLLEMYLNKIKKLNIRLEILSKRSIKDKLLTYFLTLSNYKKHKVIVIPISYTDLADYLSVDRSAMMREIKKLKEEKYIKADGKKITILNY